MTSPTPALDAHRRRLASSFADLVGQVGPEEVLEIGPGDGLVLTNLRTAGRLVRGIDVDPAAVRACADRGLEVVEGDGASLEDEDGSVDVVVLRDVLSSCEDPEAIAREAWRVARRCVVLAEPEYVAGLASQETMEWLDALTDELRFARGRPAVHAFDVGEMLSMLPEAPAACEVRSFGLVTAAPAEEVDAIVAAAAAGGDLTDVQRSQAAALREDAARGELTYPGSRVVIAFKEAREPAADPPDAVATATGDVTLKELVPDDARAAVWLQVAPSQTRFVARNAISLAQAALTEHAWFRGVAVGETIVGFVMVNTDPEDPPSPYLWRFMIDARQQGRGVGRRALELVCDHFAADGATEMHTSVVEGPGSPRGFYESLGFAETGEVEDGETVLRKAL